ncbi:MAG TPA: hypothetical protein VGJ33_16255 [Candidatus Angelobacter sp.]|jgi:hypothetical protein
MGSVAVNISQAPIDQQPDTANTIGATLLQDVGTAGIVLAAGEASSLAANGRMPFDPADPNFGSLIKITNAQGSVSVGGGTSLLPTGSSGLLVLVFIGWLIFRKKRA